MSGDTQLKRKCLHIDLQTTLQTNQARTNISGDNRAADDRIQTFLSPRATLVIATAIAPLIIPSGRPWLAAERYCVNVR